MLQHITHTIVLLYPICLRYLFQWKGEEPVRRLKEAAVLQVARHFSGCKGEMVHLLETEKQ